MPSGARACPAAASARAALAAAVTALMAGMAAGFWLPGAGNASAIAAAGPAGSWGRAIEVPGLAALNTGGLAEVTSVSCGSAGNCAAGGDYFDHGGEQGFVADERNGVWGTAIEVPGLAALNTGGGAEVTSVSCALGGQLRGRRVLHRQRGVQQGFVADERHGGWGTAIEVPGLGALNTGGDAEVCSVSCGSAGNCAAGGKYRAAGCHLQGFVAASGTASGARRSRCPAWPPCTSAAGTPRSSRCRAPRRATARPAGPTTTAIITRGSWPTSGTAAGARRSRCPAWPP